MRSPNATAARSPIGPEARDLIESAGSSSGERVWCFPMDTDYDTDLESTVADIMQCAADGKGDHILAARFLEPVRAQGNRLAAPRSGGRLAPRRPRAHRHAKSPDSACATRSICCAVAGRRRRRSRLRRSQMNTLTLRRPDDWHVHLRDGAALAAVVKFTAERFGRAIVMPNLQAGDHHDGAGAGVSRANPGGAAGRTRASSRCSRLYLTDATPPEEIDRAQGRRASSTASSCIRPAPPRTPMPV